MSTRTIPLMVGLLIILGIFSSFLSNFTVRTVIHIDKFSNERATSELLEAAKIAMPSDVPPISINLNNQPRVVPYFNENRGKIVLPIGEIFEVDGANHTLKFNSLFNLTDAVKLTGITSKIFYSMHLHQNISIELSYSNYDLIRDMKYRKKSEFILDKDNLTFFGGGE